MREVKVYLNVPYAQKDAAKALGARWDPPAKKWYVPPGKLLEPFADWRIESGDDVATLRSESVVNTGAGVVTQPGIREFVAYDGVDAPWD